MHTSRKFQVIIFALILTAVCSTLAYSQEIYPQDADRYTAPIPGEAAIGHWDITISLPNATGGGASWLEIVKSGSTTLVGRFVGMGGSARPISEIEFSPETKTYQFTIPPQWGGDATHAEFKLENGQLVGWLTFSNNKKLQWTAERAPELTYTGRQSWGTPIKLLKDGLTDWQLPRNNQWKFKNGVLFHEGTGGNVITKQKFKNFKIHVEFRYGKNANSGIYLRGRYEVQVLDSYGMHTESHQLGGIYGFISPTINMAKKPGEWQTFDITLIGRMVTVVLNGTKIICDRPIPGITGGALDSHEGEPGPIMLQGSESGSIEYRNIIITPLK